MTLGGHGKNKPKTNPIQTQTNPIPEKHKMNVTTFLTRDYENNHPGGLRKNKPNTNPIKPNFKGKKCCLV